MTILQLLLNSLFLSILSFSALAFSATEYCPKEFEVVEREKGDGWSLQKKTLPKLLCTNRFEGENFKIVYATEDEAIAFDNPNPSLIKKAANVYYHLMIARQFWIEEIKSEYVSTLDQITVRIDITNAFSNVRHFKNAEQEKNYNNAWSIPEGQSPRFAREKLKWGKEIWFSPMKKIEARKAIKSEGNNPVHNGLEMVKEPIYEYNKNALIYSGLGFIATPTIYSSTILESTIQRLATIAIIFGLTEATRYMDKWFIEKWYYIDSALVPDIIYHEFSHIAMSDTMKTIHSVPVIEGMADYFAACITKRKHVYDKLKKISTNQYKDLESEQRYHPFLEGEWNATSDFTLSLLWLGKLEFEKINEERKIKKMSPIADFNQIVFEAHKKLSESSDIMNDLTGSLLDVCSEKCSSKRMGMNTLNVVFEKKGFN